MADLTDLVRYEVTVKRVNGPTNNEYDEIVSLKGVTAYVLEGMPGIAKQIQQDESRAMREFIRLGEDREKKQDKKKEKK